MAVRKPLDKKTVDIDALIEKGASVKQDASVKKWTIFNVRIPSDMLNCVDYRVLKRIGLSRTGWVLEAIQEKLKRDDVR